MKTTIAAAILIIVAIAVWPRGATAAPPKCNFDEIVYVMDRMEFARGKHVEWEANALILGDDNPIIQIAGGAKWHRAWIEDYDRTRALIRSLVERC